ncbi:MAG: hypothetical protein ACTSUK_04005 [Promethearchaeota archaeon]
MIFSESEIKEIIKEMEKLNKDDRDILLRSLFEDCIQKISKRIYGTEEIQLFPLMSGNYIPIKIRKKVKS